MTEGPPRKWFLLLLYQGVVCFILWLVSWPVAFIAEFSPASGSHLTVSTSCSPLHSQDALQEMYKQKGTFPGEPIKPARRPWTLLNFLCWATILLSPLFSFVLGVFASGSPLLILTFLGFVGAGKKSTDMPAPMLGSLGHHPGLMAYHGDPGRLLHVGLWKLRPLLTLVWLPVLERLHTERKGLGVGNGKTSKGALVRLASNLLSLVFKASFGVRRLIGVTEIEKGSSYGNQELKKKE